MGKDYLDEEKICDKCNKVIAKYDVVWVHVCPKCYLLVTGKETEIEVVGYGKIAKDTGLCQWCGATDDLVFQGFDGMECKGGCNERDEGRYCHCCMLCGQIYYVKKDGSVISAQLHDSCLEEGRTKKG